MRTFTHNELILIVCSFSFAESPIGSIRQRINMFLSLMSLGSPAWSLDKQFGVCGKGRLVGHIESNIEDKIESHL